MQNSKKQKKNGVTHSERIFFNYKWSINLGVPNEADITEKEISFRQNHVAPLSRKQYFLDVEKKNLCKFNQSKKPGEIVNFRKSLIMYLYISGTADRKKDDRNKKLNQYALLLGWLTSGYLIETETTKKLPCIDQTIN